jgi:aminoglycoside phosphotransferase (APT) family kinase protein
MPEIDHDIPIELVRGLLDDQFVPAAPAAADLAISFVTSGWDNALFRLGDDLVIRLPLREASAPLIENEARWLPELAPRLPVAVPVPTFVGRPGRGFLWTWTIAPWIDGDAVDQLPPDRRGRLVEPLADVLLALHRPSPADAPRNPFRGVPLRERADTIAQRLDQASPRVGADAADQLRAVWQIGLDAPEWAGPPMWLHGDPHPHNVLQVGGELSGLLDFGDLTAGDPASDVATAWLMFERGDRERFLSRLMRPGTYDPALPERAAAWAVSFVTAVICDSGSRTSFDGLIDHAVRQLVSEG